MGVRKGTDHVTEKETGRIAASKMYCSKYLQLVHNAINCRQIRLRSHQLGNINMFCVFGSLNRMMYM